MMIKELATIAIFVTMIATCSLFAGDAPDSKEWIGEWLNTDAKAQSTTRLKIEAKDEVLTVQGFGRCEPTDCDYGTTTLNLCKVVGNKDETVAFASWDQEFLDLHIVLRMKAGKLIVASFYLYKDQSGRSNFSVTETFAISPDEVSSSKSERVAKPGTGARDPAFLNLRLC
jgi:hypothetical protein